MLEVRLASTVFLSAVSINGKGDRFFEERRGERIRQTLKSLKPKAEIKKADSRNWGNETTDHGQLATDERGRKLLKVESLKAGLYGWINLKK